MLSPELSFSKPCSSSLDELGVAWTKNIRSQQGEWIWFLGKGKASEREVSMYKAEGDALNNLTKECQGIHKEVKFHERCSEKKKNIYYSYARASVKHKFCDLTKKNKNRYSNKKLTQHLREYISKYINLNMVPGCNNDDFSLCAEKSSFESIKGNLKKATELASFGCESRDGNSCVVLSKILFLKNDPKYKKITSLACQYLGDNFCLVSIKKLSQDDSFTKLYHHYLKNICAIGNAESCYLYAKDSGKKYVKYQKKSCDLNYLKGCRALLDHYKKNEDSKNLRKYQLKICKIKKIENCKLNNIKNSITELEDEFGEEAIKELEL